LPVAITVAIAVAVGVPVTVAVPISVAVAVSTPSLRLVVVCWEERFGHHGHRHRL
jgi:hypothetical protein